MDMDNFCIWLQYIGQWLASGSCPVIPYIGTASGRFYNPPRAHLEIVFALTGGYPEVQIGNKSVSIPVNHVSLHNVHFGNYSPPCDTACWCLFLDVGGCKTFAKCETAPMFYSMPVSDPRQLADAFTRLQQCCLLPGGMPSYYINGPVAFTPDAVDMTQRLRVHAALMNLIAELLNNASAIEGSAPQPLPHAILAAQQYIATHSADPAIGLQEIAEAARLSIDHFGRVFKQHLGITPMQLLRDIRINQSRFLLAHTELLIEEVAIQVGITDSLYFSRVFTAVTGMSPSQYRRERRQVIGDTTTPLSI